MKRDQIVTKLQNHMPSILGGGHVKKYAVMLPLIQKEDGIHVLFEVRSQQLRRQPGEICFPGGKVDAADIDEKAAAIRETMEELGVKKDEIFDIFPLDYMYFPSDMILFPFVGYISNPENISVNPAEVGEIFSVPISFFLNQPPKIYQVQFKIEPERNFPFDLIPGGENYKWRKRSMDEYFYLYENKTIWGLTAKILFHFIEIIR
ncbi:CoA pyrophosphatase [Bacillus sp. BRMEA1]|uniref:NUDIX hydrolase n=1 Tax=Neobacillus endophyticus TaxID=2738405 RepID=UPI00156679D3|nr:CoA pyrophosphatase [Neobacillus endophyticus]NRD80397.1 CoA pyrophosphatase [Neobacillus endophyticus]